MSDKKEKIVNGTVTLHVVNGTVTLHADTSSVSHVNKVLTNSGHYWRLTARENKLVIKGKNINVDKIVSRLKECLKSVEVVKIEEDPKIHTTVLKIESLCCQENADKFKAKLLAVSGVKEVSVEVKEKKVTVKGTLEPKKVLEEASKINILAVSLWPEEKKKDEKKDGSVLNLGLYNGNFHFYVFS